MAIDQNFQAESKQLALQIQEASGYKIDHNDPVVIAALIHGKLIKEKNEEVIKVLYAHVDKSTQEISTNLKNHVDSFSTHFRDEGRAILKQIRREASAPNLTIRIRTFALVFGVFVIGIGCGFASGYQWSKPNASHQEDEAVISAGRDFLAVLPNLDETTKDKIKKELKRIRKPQ